MKTNSQKTLFILCIFFLFYLKVNATVYNWVGGTSSSWKEPDNWDPSGTPSTDDTVTIDISDNIELNDYVTIKKLTISRGSIDLAAYTLTITKVAQFDGGEINNGTIFGDSATYVSFHGTTFGAIVDIIGNEIYLDGSTFNDSLNIHKTGSTALKNMGGNTFNGPVSYATNTSSAYIAFEDTLPDTFNSTFVIDNSHSYGGVYIAHKATGTVFNDDVTLIGSNIYFNYYGTATFNGNIYLDCPGGEIYFGYSTGSSTMIDGKTIHFISGISSGGLHFRNFTLEDRGTMGITLTGSAHLYFESGSSFTPALSCRAPFIHLNGSRFLSASSFDNNATSNLTSLGGCYFAGQTSITNNASSSYTFSLGGTTADTFATTTTIQNNTGSLLINNAIFKGNVTLKNANTATSSNRFFISNTGDTHFKGVLTIDNSTSGMIFGPDGRSYIDSTGSLTFASGLTGNVTLSNFTKRGNSSQTFSFTNATEKLVLGPNNSFEGNVTFFGQDIDLKGSNFHSTVTITKYGSTDATCYGGNIFNSTTIIKDSSSSGHYLKLGNTSSDVFNGNVTFIQKNSGLLYPAYATPAYFSGNITVDGTSAITFGSNGGKVVLNGTSAQSINKIASYAPVIKKMTVNKSNGDLTLNTPLSITDSLILQKGITNTDSLNYLLIADNGKTIGGSDTSFVDGPFSKIGNDAFTFPLGSKAIMYGKYHPLSISAPGSINDKYTGEYNYGYHNKVNTLDTIKISYTEFWKLYRTTGTSSVDITLGWNTNSSEVWDITKVYVARYDGTNWSNVGGKNIIQNNSVGSVVSNSSVNLNNSIINIFTVAGPLARIKPTVDITPYRGLYVNKFLNLTGGVVNAGKSILGIATKEDELLNFAKDNNFKYLTLYDIETVFDHYNDIYPGSSPSRTYGEILCEFVTKAKQQYCIEQIAIATSDKSYFNDINGTLVLNITGPYTFPSNSLFSLNNPLEFITHQFTTSDDQQMALRAEMAKYYISTISFNSDCGYKINIMTTEYEFWASGGNPDALWHGYEDLLNDMDAIRTLALTTDPLLIEVYLGWFNPIPADFSNHHGLPNGHNVITNQDEVNIIDAIVDRTDIHAYRLTPFDMWVYSENRIKMFDNNICQLCDHTIIRPIYSNEHFMDTNQDPLHPSPAFLGPWLDDGISHPENTIYTAEQRYFYDMSHSTSYPSPHDNIINSGAGLWFTYTLFTHNNSTSVSGEPDWSYDCSTNNELFYGDGNVSECTTGSHTITGCRNAAINFNYVGNYEPGVTCDWDFGDGSSLNGHTPVFPTTAPPAPEVISHQYLHRIRPVKYILLEYFS